MITVFTCTDKKYQGYAELWEYLIKRAYPSYNVEVFNTDYAPHCIRHLIYPLHTPLYSQSVYVTDIDMMIMPEAISIAEFHQNEMQETNLCYSNSVRNNEEEWAFERVTGLQYNTPQWYKETERSREKYYNMIMRKEFGEHRVHDELMLKRIITESDLDMCPKKSLIARHHGIHVGVCRAYRWQTTQLRENAMQRRITPLQAQWWQTVVNSQEYKDIHSRIDNKDILWELRCLDSFTKRWEKTL